MRALDSLKRVGADENDVEVIALPHLVLDLRISLKRRLVVRAEVPHLGLPRGSVIHDQEVLDSASVISAVTSGCGALKPVGGLRCSAAGGSGLGAKAARDAIQVADRLLVAAIKLGQFATSPLQNAVALLLGKLCFCGNRFHLTAESLRPQQCPPADYLRHKIAQCRPALPSRKSLDYPVV